MWACRLTERTDFSYERYRWVPKDCELPTFERSTFLQRYLAFLLLFAYSKFEIFLPSPRGEVKVALSRIFSHKYFNPWQSSLPFCLAKMSVELVFSFKGGARYMQLIDIVLWTFKILKVKLWLMEMEQCIQYVLFLLLVTYSTFGMYDSSQAKRTRNT